VNTFLRRSAFSPNTEIFAMRLHKLTLSIFPNNCVSERRIPNKAKPYTHIHQTMKHISTTYQNATIHMRIHPPDTPPKSGEFARWSYRRENL
jgi:hypothetical protein